MKAWKTVGRIALLALIFSSVATAQVGGVRLPGQVGNTRVANSFGSVGGTYTRAGSDARPQFGAIGPVSPASTLGMVNMAGRSSLPGAGLSRATQSSLTALNSLSRTPLTLSGVTVTAPRAEIIMSHQLSGNSLSDSGYLRLDTSSPVSRLVGSSANGITNIGVDRYGMVFARRPLNLAPQALPPPPSLEATSADNAVTPPPPPPPPKRAADLRERAREEASYYFSQGSRKLFAGATAEGPRFDAVRDGQFEFDRARRLLPEDPLAYLWSSVSAIHMGNVNEGMELWRQCLARYERQRADLDALRFDLNTIDPDPAEVARIKRAATVFLTAITSRFNLSLDEAPPALRPRGKALTAITMWLANERDAYNAAERVQQAQIVEAQTLAAEDRAPVLGILYDQLMARKDQPTIKPAP